MSSRTGLLAAQAAPADLGLIGGRYRPVRIVGESDDHILYETRHVQLDELFLVKVLRDGVTDPRLAARFVRDARNCVRVKNDHVVKFVDVGLLDDGRPYVAMEHLDGCDLASMIGRGPALREDDIVDWVMQACEAVAAGHQVGIIHRDLHTASLFFATLADGTRLIKVMNFGTTRMVNSAGQVEDQGLTMAGVSTAHPAYVAPEVFAKPNGVDPRADVWSFGVILYELLSGMLPFRGSYQDIVKKVLSDKPAALRSLRPAVTSELERIVMKCLEKDPEKRPASVEALRLSLAALGGKAKLASHEVAPGRELRFEPPPRRDSRYTNGTGSVMTRNTRSSRVLPVLAGEETQNRRNETPLRKILKGRLGAFTSATAVREQPLRELMPYIALALATVGLCWVTVTHVVPALPSRGGGATTNAAQPEPSAARAAPTQAPAATPSAQTPVVARPAPTPPTGFAPIVNRGAQPAPKPSASGSARPADPFGWER